jgi:peptidoglycan hydrolase CwlO-like protein
VTPYLGDKPIEKTIQLALDCGDFTTADAINVQLRGLHKAQELLQTENEDKDNRIEVLLSERDALQARVVELEREIESYEADEWNRAYLD